MLASLKKRLPTKISLRFFIVSFFLIQSFLIIGTIGYFSFSNGRKTISHIASHLGAETSAHIEQHLDEFLAAPQKINQVNANAIQQGWLNVDDPTALERYFVEQIRVFDSVTSIYFGNAAGGLVDANRNNADGQQYVLVTDEFASGTLRKYVVDSEGNHLELVETRPNFDARTRIWYVGAAEKGEHAWSDPYVLFTGQDMAVAASRPVYDAQHQLLGVISTEISVSQLSDFLQQLDIGVKGSIFIIDREGLLVASSTDEEPFVFPEDGLLPRRLSASESAEPNTRAADSFLTAQFGDYHEITDTQQFQFEIDGKRQFLQVSPVQDKHGIDWLVVVAIPELEFVPEINTLLRSILLNVTVAMLLSIILGIFTAQWLTKPVQRLKKSTHALAHGDWEQTLNREWVSELDDLAQSFNFMIERLRQTMESLAGEITERLQVEVMLRDSEKKYRSLIEGSSDAIFLLCEGRFELVNQRFTELFVVTEEEVRAPNFDFMNLVAPRSQPQVQEYMTKQQQGEFLSPYYTFTAQDKAGNEIEIEASVSYVPCRHTTATQGILRDITKRVRTNEMLRQSNQRLEHALVELHETQEQMKHQERLAAVGQLAAGIAHDFNNLLAIITIYTQLSLEMDEPPPTIRRRLEIVDSTTNQAADLVQQILDFGRKSILNRTKFALDLLLEEMVEMLSPTLPKDIKLEFTFEQGEYIIEADRTRVNQAILNLVLNARDVLPEGGMIHLSLSRVSNTPIQCAGCGPIEKGEWLRVDVMDSGPGIPFNVMPHLFEPFFTTRAPLGHGLGLAQVYGIIKQHLGHIGVETVGGRGSTFTLYWPTFPTQEEKTHPAL